MAKRKRKAPPKIPRRKVLCVDLGSWQWLVDSGMIWTLPTQEQDEAMILIDLGMVKRERYDDSVFSPNAHEQLWMAALGQAFLDATDATSNYLSARERDVARDWLLTVSEDLIEVCRIVDRRVTEGIDRARLAQDADWDLGV